MAVSRYLTFVFNKYLLSDTMDNAVFKWSRRFRYFYGGIPLRRKYF